jgi:hypothetical protein
MALWESIKARFDRSSDGVVHAVIPDGGPAIRAYGGYFRLWLQDMRLARAVSWGQEAFPAVHSEVRVHHAGAEAQAFACLSRPSENALAQGAWTEYQLTELMPYNGGTVEVESALLSLPGRNTLAPALDALGQLAGLLLPPVGQALPLARTLAKSAGDLLSPYKDAVHVGVHHTLVADGDGQATTLRPGWIVVARSPDGRLDAGALSVDGGRVLHAGEPVTGTDMILLRIEGRVERPDWRLPEIDVPLKRALIALDEGNVNSAGGYRALALAAARESPALAEDDRARVIDVIKSSYAGVESETSRGISQDAQPDLDQLMRRLAIPRERLAGLAPLDEEAIFA